jgi:hypothetical protein
LLHRLAVLLEVGSPKRQSRSVRLTRWRRRNRRACSGPRGSCIAPPSCRRWRRSCRRPAAHLCRGATTRPRRRLSHRSTRLWVRMPLARPVPRVGH